MTKIVRERATLLFKKLSCLLTLFTLLAFTGCQSSSQPSPIMGGDANQAQTNPAPLTIGLMPAVDAAPILVALKNGYFDELNLQVNVQVYTNAMDRQSALQAGSIDGSITDVISLISNVANGFDIKATTTTDGSFPVVVRSGFDESSPSATVGLMQASVVNYLADQYLGPRYTLNKVYIDDIQARIEMLKSGQIDMAVLPEPMASLAQSQGLTKETYTSDDSYSPEVMVFTGKALSGKAGSIALFQQAYNKAVDAISQDDSTARDELVAKLNLNAGVRDMMTLPAYHHTQVPDKAFMQKMIDWTNQTLGQNISVTYDQLIDARFIQ